VLTGGVVAVSVYGSMQVHNLMDVLAVWNRWDAPHYLDIAVFGYRAVDNGDLFGPNGYRSVYPGDLPLYIVFYPLFPAFVGVLTAISGQPLISAFVVSTAASLFVAPLLYRVVRTDETHRVAMRAAWFLLIFPTAYVLHIGYTESLFLALVLGSFLAAHNERWWLAGGLGGLAALTRINGLVLVPALMAEAATQWFARPPAERRIRPEWAAIGLVGVGFAVYLGINVVVYGNPLEFLRIQQEHWFKSLAPPWDGIAGLVSWLDRPNPDESLMRGGVELLFAGVGLLATVHAAVRLRPAYFTWMALNWLLFLSTSFVLSVPRYTLTLFPLFISLGLVTERRRWLTVLISVVFIGAFGYFGARFANGAWAF
jgi:Dolichyl-phosphate-mannose-protein mannosyltransferase